MDDELPLLPDGYSFVVDDNGAYLVDSNGAYVVQRTAGAPTAISPDEQMAQPEAIWYVPETTLGVMPQHSTDWRTLRFTGESLMPRYDTDQSAEITASRMRGDVAQVAANVDGDIGIELSAGQLDEFMEAALCGTWEGDALKVGLLRRSFTFAKFFADFSTTDRYDIYNGLSVGQLTLTFRYGSLAEGSISLLGLDAWSDTATPIGTGSVSPPSNTAVFSGASDVISIAVDGLTGIYVDELTLTLGASVRAKTALGHKFPFSLGFGSAVVDGSFRAYFEDRNTENKVRSGAPFSLRFTIGDAANRYTFDIPRAFHTSRDGLAASAMDSDVMPTYSFSSAFDEASGSPVTITRVAG